MILYSMTLSHLVIFLKRDLLQISSGLEVILVYFCFAEISVIELSSFFLAKFGVLELSIIDFTEFGVLEFFWNCQNNLFL